MVVAWNIPERHDVPHAPPSACALRQSHGISTACHSNVVSFEMHVNDGIAIGTTPAMLMDAPWLHVASIYPGRDDAE
jgi:hypothetical protein